MAKSVSSESLTSWAPAKEGGTWLASSPGEQPFVWVKTSVTRAIRGESQGAAFSESSSKTDKKEGGQINQGRVGGSGKSLHWRNHRNKRRERRRKTGRKRWKKDDDSENRENVPEHNRPLTLPAALFAPPPHPTLSLPFHQKSPANK